MTYIQNKEIYCGYEENAFNNIFPNNVKMFPFRCSYHSSHNVTALKHEARLGSKVVCKLCVQFLIMKFVQC